MTTARGNHLFEKINIKNYYTMYTEKSLTPRAGVGLQLLASSEHSHSSTAGTTNNFTYTCIKSSVLYYMYMLINSSPLNVRYGEFTDLLRDQSFRLSDRSVGNHSKSIDRDAGQAYIITIVHSFDTYLTIRYNNNNRSNRSSFLSPARKEQRRNQIESTDDCELLYIIYACILTKLLLYSPLVHG